MEIGDKVRLNTPHQKLEVDDGRGTPILNGNLGTVVAPFRDGFIGVAFDITSAGMAVPGKRVVIPGHWVTKAGGADVRKWGGQ